MAKKRMFRLDVLETDAFMEMPLTTQALYFHLNLRADDDGFVSNPKLIVKFIGASIDDLKLLIAKRFVLTFDDGVIVIKHWRMHNTLSKDRYHETNFIEDKAMLRLKDNKAYTFDQDGEVIDDTKLIEMSQRQTKDEQNVSRDKGIDKTLNKDNNNILSSKQTKQLADNLPLVRDVIEYLNEKAGTNFKYGTEKTQRCIKARVNEGFSLPDFQTVIDKKCASWMGTEFQQYLRPETLFGPKFEGYLNEQGTKLKSKKENQFNQMIHSKYDYDEIERMVLK